MGSEVRLGSMSAAGAVVKVSGGIVSEPEAGKGREWLTALVAPFLTIRISSSSSPSICRGSEL